MKSFKGRHKDLMKGEDVKDNRGLMARKGKQMFEKIKHNKSAFKQRDKDGKRVYSEKAMGKIARHQQHTRSKVIVKNGKGNFQAKQGKGRGRK